MNIDERNDESKAYLGFRASLDLSMGVLYIFISVYAALQVFIIEQFGESTVYTIAGLFVFYGFVRLYRGYSALMKFLKTNDKPNRRTSRS